MPSARLEPEDVLNWVALSLFATILVGLFHLIRALNRALKKGVRFVRNSLSPRDADLPHAATIR
ncbi:hypothetical protein E8E11_000620 [Didymella keratinophila]|nr:hypothetical protein E8E11_000620 [Didymella keratinophila]